MRKFLCICICLFCYSLYSQDFRNVNWGMSIEEVQKNEKAEQITQSDKNYLQYSVSINNYDLTLYYLFSENKLWGAEYNGTRTNQSVVSSYKNHKTFFLTMKNTLDLKYGNPIIPSASDDFFVYYDNGKQRKYVNYELNDFLDSAESDELIIYKMVNQRIGSDGYTYSLKYEYKHVVIILTATQKQDDLIWDISYITKEAYKGLNTNIKDSVLKNSEGLRDINKKRQLTTAST